MSDHKVAAEEVANPAVEVKTDNVEDSKPVHADAKANGSRFKGKNYSRDNYRGRHSGKDFSNFPKKTNTDYDNLPESDDPVKIRDQVEFYFSEQNLRTDEHLFKQLRGPENNPVPLKHITTFKRMRRFQPYTAIVNALRESVSLVVVDDGSFAGVGNEGVKRKVPIDCPKRGEDEENPPSLNELFRRMGTMSYNALEKSIYAKGFGEDSGATQISLEEFFMPYGSVMVRMRRHNETDEWKGSVFVEFDTEESKKQFLELDPKPKYNGNELSIEGKKEYTDRKCKEKGITPTWERKGLKEGGGGKEHRGRKDYGRGRGRYHSNRRGRDYHQRSRSPRHRRASDSGNSDDSRDWNRRRDRFQKKWTGPKHDRHDKRDGRYREERDRDTSDKRETIKDERGVPIIRDTRDQADKPNKRKADDSDREGSPKRTKIEIKQDA